MTKTKTLKVLLIEDNPAHAELVKRSFYSSNVDYELYHIDDGEEALNFLLRTGKYSGLPQQFHANIILLDLKLPKVNGLEILRQIKSHDDLKVTPVVVLTTSRAEGDLLAAYENHVNSYLVKPIDFNEFNALMNAMGHYWLEVNIA